MDEGAIFLCCPSYDGRAQIMGAWNFFNCPTQKLQDRLVYAGAPGNSLLGLAFNGNLCIALNAGPNIAYFGMLHDDIIPQDGWLDVLWDELHAHGADVISAVVPIKDIRGLTSTAIDNPRDRFNVSGRLTMKQVRRLPKTFRAEDCGQPKGTLLLNTGCWLARMSVLRRWVNEYAGCFTIADRIIKAPDGKYVAQVAPEDWNFSRDLNRIGAKLVATSAVRVRHMGRFEFDSADTWGQEFDEIYGLKLPGQE